MFTTGNKYRECHFAFQSKQLTECFIFLRKLVGKNTYFSVTTVVNLLYITSVHVLVINNVWLTNSYVVSTVKMLLQSSSSSLKETLAQRSWKSSTSWLGFHFVLSHQSRSALVGELSPALNFDVCVCVCGCPSLFTSSLSWPVSLLDWICKLKRSRNQCRKYKYDK